MARRAFEPDISVLEAEDGEAGLALLDQPETIIDLVVTDFMMPKINGLGVMAVLARYRPELPIIGMTGDADPVLREAAAKYGARVLQKPFDIGVLVASARELLAASRPGSVRALRQARAGKPHMAGRGLVAAAMTLASPKKVPCS